MFAFSPKSMSTFAQNSICMVKMKKQRHVVFGNVPYQSRPNCHLVFFTKTLISSFLLVFSNFGHNLHRWRKKNSYIYCTIWFFQIYLKIKYVFGCFCVCAYTVVFACCYCMNGAYEEYIILLIKTSFFFLIECCVWLIVFNICFYKFIFMLPMFLLSFSLFTKVYHLFSISAAHLMFYKITCT